MWRPITLSIIATSLLFSIPVFAENPVKLKDLKKKYWKGDEKSTLDLSQKRVLRKKNRFRLALGSGLMNRSEILDTYSLNVGAHYFPLDWLSFGVSGFALFPNRSRAYEQLKSHNLIAAGNYPRYNVNADFTLNALYGKVSWVRSAILYYDLYLILSSGITRYSYRGENEDKTVDTNAFVIGPGIGQHFFINHWLGFFLEYRSYFSNEIINGLERSSSTDELSREIQFSHYLTLGLTVFL